MSVDDAWVRPDDVIAYRKALRIVRQHTGVPLVFGGQILDRTLVLSDVIGARSNALRGLRIDPGKGAGGHVLRVGRPVYLEDYRSAETITHEYDAAVTREGISGLVAVPVKVAGAVRGVLYAASRAGAIGDTATGVVDGVARRLAGEIAVRDEVERRLQRITHSVAERVGDVSDLEEIREISAELRRIASELSDPGLRERLRSATGRLVHLGRPPQEPTVDLTPRELDVLGEVALGCSNAEAAERLDLLPETVKAYLRSASQKLGTSGRIRTVREARRLRLLP
jgi:DNA-binding CsgD family transcriptional regulator